MALRDYGGNWTAAPGGPRRRMIPDRAGGRPRPYLSGLNVGQSESTCRSAETTLPRAMISASRRGRDDRLPARVALHLHEIADATNLDPKRS
jgi:hypothetical protein